MTSGSQGSRWIASACPRAGRRPPRTGLREPCSGRSELGNRLLELPTIETLDRLSLRAGKIELACDRLGSGEKPVAQFLIQQRSAEQFRQLPARQRSGVGVQF